MSLHSALRAVSRFALVAIVAIGGIATLSDSADAKRFKVRSGGGDAPHSAPHSTPHAANATDGASSGPPGLTVRPRARREGKEENAEANGSGAAPAAATAAEPAKEPRKVVAEEAPVKDTVVEGCAPGHVCTVCIAGCVRTREAIVHQQTMSGSLIK